MGIHRLELSQIRNISDATLQPSYGVNILQGHNGSGKTSILEAIYILGLGRSFRTRHLNRVIQRQAARFSIFAETSVDSTVRKQLIPLGIERMRSGRMQFKVAGDLARSVAELAEVIAVQLMNHQSYLVLQQEPAARRKMLDWGVFHVEHRFYHLWQRMRRALKQRNALLREGCKRDDLRSWDKEWVTVAEDIHPLRQDYCNQWFLAVQQLLVDFPELPAISFNYRPGWDTSAGLAEALRADLNRDLHSGYTHAGPHRADIIVKAEDELAAQVLSLGQQKCVVSLLQMAQGILMQAANSKPCIYLIDDLPAELDNVVQKKILSWVGRLKAQVFLTSVHSLELESTSTEAKMFHVEHGTIKEMV